MEKIMLTLKEVCECTGWSESSVRRIAANKNNNFVIRLGNKIYFHKQLFNEYLVKCAKYNIAIK